MSFGRREGKQAVGHMGRQGVSYVHWCCGDERHLDRLRALSLRGGRVEGGLGCFGFDGFIWLIDLRIGDSGAW
jgi:hypothetical protein